MMAVVLSRIALRPSKIGMMSITPLSYRNTDQVIRTPRLRRGVNSVILPATKPPTESQAGISSEQFSKDLNPRSVPTIAYRVQGASAPIGLMPVAPYAVSTQRASDGGASVPNVIVFAGAALGCLGAGSILWFAGRNLTSARGSFDLDPHNLEERPSDCLSAAIFPSPMMDDWAADLRRKLDEHGRDWPGAHKAAEGDFASAPRSS